MLPWWSSCKKERLSKTNRSDEKTYKPSTDKVRLQMQKGVAVHRHSACKNVPNSWRHEFVLLFQTVPTLALLCLVHCYAVSPLPLISETHITFAPRPSGEQFSSIWVNNSIKFEDPSITFGRQVALIYPSRSEKCRPVGYVRCCCLPCQWLNQQRC
jgi:hypothetical protein